MFGIVDITKGFILPQQGTSGPSRKPLKCRVMHHKVVAHQMCAVQMLGWLSKITNYSGLLLTFWCCVLVNSDFYLHPCIVLS